MPDFAHLTASFVSRACIGSAGALLVWTLSGVGVAGQPAQLTIDSVNVRQEGVVSFSTLALGTEPRADFPANQFLIGQTDDQSYRLCVDLGSIQQLRFNAFTFAAYLVSEKGPANEAYKFQVTGNPAGSFHDSPVRVSFHVKSGTNVIQGSIMMPVYNATASDQIVPEKQAAPAYVSVSGNGSFEVHLANVADTLPIAVTEVGFNSECPRCWTRISTDVSDKSPIVIQPGGSAALPLNLSPSTIPALLQGALAIKSDVPHDTIALNVTYHTVPGGTDRRQTIPAMVRFGPGLVGLTLALFGGLTLGLAARYLLTGKLGKDNERAVHAILAALVLAIVAEFIGIMLTAYGNSRLIMFGMDIDPRQLFPAFVLAMLVSGGGVVVSWIKELFGKA